MRCGMAACVRVCVLGLGVGLFEQTLNQILTEMDGFEVRQHARTRARTHARMCAQTHTHTPGILVIEKKQFAAVLYSLTSLK